MSEEGLRTERYWRDRAEEARNIADKMVDKVAKEMMLDIAKRYDLMARLAAEREGRARNQ